VENRRIVVFVVVVVALLLALWLVRYLSPEQVVRRQLLGAIEAFEKEQLLGVVSVLSRGYDDPWGQSYESIAGNLSEVMASYDDLRVDLDLESVDRAGEDVRVRLDFVISGSDGGGTGYVLGSLADPCRATILWREEPQGWRLVTTETLDIPELREHLNRVKSR
jgi:hypothetical protein